MLGSTQQEIDDFTETLQLYASVYAMGKIPAKVESLIEPKFEGIASRNGLDYNGIYADALAAEIKNMLSEIEKGVGLDGLGATITTIPGFNLESDSVVEMMDRLKSNKDYKKIVIRAGKDYFTGANPLNVYNEISTEFAEKVINYDFMEKVVDKLNENSPRMAYPSDSPKHIELFAKILAKGIMFEFTENPYQFAKELGDADLIKAANDFSVNRGKAKFSTMYENKFGTHGLGELAIESPWDIMNTGVADDMGQIPIHHLRRI
jgi:hypothetical protein